jgi:RimJ/RimL family protein N-acetyltransferase
MTSHDAAGEMRVSPVVLSGRWVRLEPLDELHREPLRRAADDARIWQHTVMVARGAAFDRWFDAALARRDAGTELPFAVRALADGDGELVGSTRYLDPVAHHRRLEIGSTWYHPRAWGSAINPECKYLLLAHAFEVMRANRVELCTDVRNVRSQAAIEKLGAVREGVLRSHMIVQEGRVRDSVLFSIIAAEWPATKATLEARLPHSI